MKKNTILKKIDTLEDKICNAIHELQDFLDSTEDPELSSMGSDLCDQMIDFLHDNDTVNINEIRDFVTNELEQ